MGTNLLGIGTRALEANMTALQVTGNNIANVNTPGYSRQVVQFRSAGGQLDSGGFVGKGVEVAAITRSHSDYLTRQAQLTSSIAAADETRSGKLALLEPIFASGDNGIGAAVSGTLNAFGDVSTLPSDLSARQVVLARADEMAARLRDASAQITLVGQGIGAEIRQNVDQINQLAGQIASVNSTLSNMRGSDAVPNELYDKRDQLVTDLNKLVQATTVANPDGSMSVFIGGSQNLVIGGKAMALSLQADEYDTAVMSVCLESNGGKQVLSDAQVAGGSLAGLMKFQRIDMTDARNQLGRLAMASATLMNEEHQLGRDMKGNAGTNLFAIAPVPDALASKNNTGNGVVGATITDATAFAASDYMIKFSAAGVEITRVSDGNLSSFASLPAQLDGLSLDVSSGTVQSGDSYLLRPFSQAATDLRLAVTSPLALAMGNPVAVSAGTTNAGDVTVSSLTAASADANLTANVTLSFNGNGTFNVSGTGTGNPVNVSYVAGQPIEYNGWKLILSGTPAAGDTLTVAAATGATRDTTRAQAFLDLRDRAVFDGASLVDGYAGVLANIGTKVQTANYSTQVSKSMASQAAQSQASVSGVNLDEEAARLLQYQQAYQASARILQVAQGVFDDLLNQLS